MRIHVSRETVYYMEGPNARICTVKEGDLESAKDLLQAGQVHVLGIPSNAALITKLYEMRKEEPGQRLIYIGYGRKRRRPIEQEVNPIAVLNHMSTIDYCASTAGWHVMTEWDYLVYSLLHAAAAETRLWEAFDGHVATSRTLRLAKQHPAWPAFTFVGAPDFVAAVRLLTLIIDPRWHYDNATMRFSPRLLTALGVGEDAPPTRMKNVVEIPDEARKIYKQHFASMEALVRSWAGPGPLIPTLCRMKQSSRIEEPGNFLWRIVAKELDVSSHIGFLKASRQFVRFLAYVWLDNMTPHRELFVPEYFFQDRETAAAWRAHMESARMNGNS